MVPETRTRGGRDGVGTQAQMIAARRDRQRILDEEAASPAQEAEDALALDPLWLAQWPCKRKRAA
jgi:hypothetical protein